MQRIFGKLKQAAAHRRFSTLLSTPLGIPTRTFKSNNSILFTQLIVSTQKTAAHLGRTKEKSGLMKNARVGRKSIESFSPDWFMAQFVYSATKWAGSYISSHDALNTLPCHRAKVSREELCVQVKRVLCHLAVASYHLGLARRFVFLYNHTSLITLLPDPWCSKMRGFHEANLVVGRRDHLHPQCNPQSTETNTKSTFLAFILSPTVLFKTLNSTNTQNKFP